MRTNRCIESLFFYDEHLLIAEQHPCKVVYIVVGFAFFVEIGACVVLELKTGSFEYDFV